MRQVHRAGEKTFMDYSGKRLHVVDRRTGEERPVELFVAALGASSYIFAEATEAQDLPSWVGSHIRMAESFGGSTAIWVPDNLKSGVTTPCGYEPEVNRTCTTAGVCAVLRFLAIRRVPVATPPHHIEEEPPRHRARVR